MKSQVHRCGSEGVFAKVNGAGNSQRGRRLWLAEKDLTRIRIDFILVPTWFFARLRVGVDRLSKITEEKILHVYQTRDAGSLPGHSSGGAKAKLLGLNKHH